MTIDRLAAQVLGWANDRNLIEGSTLTKQYIKLVEEHGEYAAGLARGKDEVMADALGDKLVILIIMAGQAGIHIPKELSDLAGCDDVVSYDASVEAIRKNLEDDKIGVERSFLQATYNVGTLADVLINNNTRWIEPGIAALFGDTLAQIFEHNWEPTTILEDVWNIIKDRKGKMVDGVFIKEHDAMMAGGENKQ